MRSLTYYRERAERCRVFAAKCRTRNMMNELLMLADEFDRRAEAAEARKKRRPRDKWNRPEPDS